MTFHRLSWRVGLPFVLLVLIETLALAAYSSAQMEDEERDRLVRVAATNADVVVRSSLQATESLARQMESVSGYATFFRSNGRLEPALPKRLSAVPVSDVPADGVPRRSGAFDVVAVPAEGKPDVVMVGEHKSYWLDSRVLGVLAAFLVLAILTAWLVVRSLVHPLRHLAARLPEIERPGPIELPAALRNDELGDVARSFLRTRQALHDEQEARQRAEKLAVLGRMTAALAHEVQNPVAAIRMHAQLWQRGQVDGTAATIEHEASRIESLLNQWLFLTRPEPPAMAPTDVGALLAGVVAMHQPRADHAAVQIRLDIGPDLRTLADGRRLDQVFRNLLLNALQAMPGGGTLEIEARRDRDGIRIEFRDSGAGFSAAALARFAEFFFSEREGGMGIGLSVASEIVKAHGGSLQATNGEHGGAVVTVEIPVTEVSAAHGVTTTAS